MARSTPMPTLAPPNGPELIADVKSGNVELLPGATICRPSMQKDLKEAGRPAARASPVTFVHVNWPAVGVCHEIGPAVSPWNVTGAVTARTSLDNWPVVASIARGSSFSMPMAARIACLRRSCWCRTKRRRFAHLAMIAPFVPCLEPALTSCRNRAGNAARVRGEATRRIRERLGGRPCIQNHGTRDGTQWALLVGAIRLRE